MSLEAEICALEFC